MDTKNHTYKIINSVKKNSALREIRQERKQRRVSSVEGTVCWSREVPESRTMCPSVRKVLDGVVQAVEAAYAMLVLSHHCEAVHTGGSIIKARLKREQLVRCIEATHTPRR